MTKLRHLFIFSMATALLPTSSTQAAETQQKIERLTLTNNKIAAEITPDIGGRLLSVALVGKPNFLRVSDAVERNPNPAVSPQANNVGYLGHEIWVGPQSEWWIHQSLNTQRAEAKVDWPPDPYLILPKNTLLEKTAHKIALQSPHSPISGVQLTKTYSLLPGQNNSLQLDVRAQNIRPEQVSWDIWFNTRVYANTQVYIPVAGEQDVRVKQLENDFADPLVPRISDGFFSLDMVPPRAGKESRKGKVFIQPAQGWMAGFHGDQVLIIKFPLLPKTAIHPEHGQIELYSEFIPQAPDDGLLEMEVHAAYTPLMAQQTMSAREVWTLLEYKGPATRAAQLAFLRKHQRDLQLP